MKSTVALLQDKTGTFQFQYENGRLKTESIDLSYAKHNLLCFGRLNKNLTINPLLRRGFMGKILENRNFYSTAWVDYLEGNTASASLNSMITEFNAACNRDLTNGLITERIILQTITKLDRNTIQFTIMIGPNTTQIPILI